MSQLPFIQANDVIDHLAWTELCDAFVAGHQKPRADIDDILFKHGNNALLNRAAWVAGVGIGIKTATIFPSNVEREPSIPNVQAMFSLFDDATGSPQAIIDGLLVTRWKTAADSALGARLLAREDSRTLTIIGAGAVADSLVDAYRAVLPDLTNIRIWNRTPAKAETLAQRKQVEVVADLATALADSDIVASATMATEPFLRGDWIQPGTHVDLIGAYRPDMREADDALVQKSRIFVDARETAMHDIGELGIPLSQGVINENDVLGDFYDLCTGQPGRTSDTDITLFKNGGGAHLDLMTALYIQKVWQQHTQQK